MLSEAGSKERAACLFYSLAYCQYSLMMRSESETV